MDKLAKGEVLLFAGSGISTENPDTCGSTFYDRIRHELNVEDHPPFPALMDMYVDRPDGRVRLLQAIKDRFDYFSSFDDFLVPMTRFHRAVSRLHMLKNIVTTNWDDFFERICGIDAFVHDSDLALWDASVRRVMKIHGSIRNFGSIVATSDDYKKSFRRLNDGPLGAHLKSLLARNTVVYVGYSLSDENYLRLLKNVAQMMGATVRHSYFVSPNIDRATIAKAPVPLTAIETDGAFFLEQLSNELVGKRLIVSEDAFDACDELLGAVQDVHQRTADVWLRSRHPLIVFALSYQDGLIHALQRIARQRRAGEYHDPHAVHSRIHGYLAKTGEFTKRRDYWNASYALGYEHGLTYLLLQNDDPNPSLRPPDFDFPFNVTATSLSELTRYPKTKVPVGPARQAGRIIDRLKERELIPDHTPYL